MKCPPNGEHFSHFRLLSPTWLQVLGLGVILSSSSCAVSVAQSGLWPPCLRTCPSAAGRNGRLHPAAPGTPGPALH